MSITLFETPDSDQNREEAPAATSLFVRAMDVLYDLHHAPYAERITSDEQGVLMAMGGSFRADCTRRQVCSIVTDAHGRVIGAGYNGAPPGYPGCLSSGACPRGRQSPDAVAHGSSYTSGNGVCHALHAEKNGLLFSDPIARRGGTMYVTHAPCDQCSLDLAGSGLARVVWPERRSLALLQPGGGHDWVIRQRRIGPGEPIGGIYF